MFLTCQQDPSQKKRKAGRRDRKHWATSPLVPRGHQQRTPHWTILLDWQRVLKFSLDNLRVGFYKNHILILYNFQLKIYTKLKIKLDCEETIRAMMCYPHSPPRPPFFSRKRGTTCIVTSVATRGQPCRLAILRHPHSRVNISLRVKCF